jgi:S1-C subfamily serine protease
VLEDNELFESVSAEVGAPVVAILGGTYLRWFLTTMDFPRQSMTLRAYREPDHIDPAEFVAVGFTLEPRGGEWVIGRVIPGTDAEAEGLLAGQQVLTLDGTSTAGLGRAEVDALVAGFSLGEELPVGVLQGQEMVEVLVSVEDLLPEFEAPR